MNEKGRPKQYYIGDKVLCMNCIYFKKQTSNSNSVTSFCDYLSMEGYSRVFNPDGTRRIRKGYCDKFKPRIQQGITVTINDSTI